MKNQDKVNVSMSIVLIAVIMILTASCSKSSMANMTGTGGNYGNNGSGTPAANSVSIQGMAFNPSTITITAGSTVTWKNNDMVNHNVTSNPALFSSGSLAPGSSYSYTFANAGTYSYSCTIHPSMTGTVVVNAVMTTPGY